MNKLIKCKFCDKTAIKQGMCHRHFNRTVRQAIEMINSVKNRDKGYERMRVKEKFGVFG